jgi:predicted transcriptional regulator
MAIIASILDAANGGSLKTRILRHSNLSFVQLEDYLLILEERGLISRELTNEEFHTIFQTTQLGREFLRKYEGLMNIVNTDKSELFAS